MNKRFFRGLLRRPMSVSTVRSTTASGSQVYESSRAVHEYLLFHYGSAEEFIPFSCGPAEALSFPLRSAEIVSGLSSPSSPGDRRVLDIGCAVGGASFQLTKSFDEVVGIDFSQHFIDAAIKMKSEKSMVYEVQKQGTIFVQLTAKLPEDVDVSKVRFQTGDACNLDKSLGQFDAIHASNLLCRLPSPRKFISDVPQLLKPGGFLVLISPYSWLEEYTAHSEWFGGQIKDGIEVDSFNELRSFIGSSLKLFHEEDVPFLIREHERKFQYGVSHCTVWQKPR